MNFITEITLVATVLRWGGQNYGHLHHVFSRCCMPKIIKIGQCFT